MIFYYIFFGSWGRWLVATPWTSRNWFFRLHSHTHTHSSDAWNWNWKRIKLTFLLLLPSLAKKKRGIPSGCFLGIFLMFKSHRFVATTLAIYLFWWLPFSEFNEEQAGSMDFISPHTWKACGTVATLCASLRNDSWIWISFTAIKFS